MVWIVGAFAASLPAQLAAFQHPDTASIELNPGAVLALRQAGISLDAYAWVAVGFGSLAMVVSAVLALVLFARRSDDWTVLLVSLFAPAYCAGNVGPTAFLNTAPSGSPLAIGLAVALAAVLFAIAVAVLLLFPSGHFVPWWSWTLLLGCIPWAAVVRAAPGFAFPSLGYPLFLGAALGCQIYRYRRVSTPMQRQQTRWVLLGLAAVIAVNQAFWLPSASTPLGKTLYAPFAFLAAGGVVLVLPVTLFIAIERYRLYEIDILINRGLVYGALTAILATVYFGGVVGARTVIGVIAGPVGADQPVVIVATTLFVAALFQPLRRALQTLIDRRFYRSKYDAARTMGAFGAVLREEVDLEALMDHLLEAVQRTMQPEHISLWLCDPEALSPIQMPRTAGQAPPATETVSEHGRVYGARHGMGYARLALTQCDGCRRPWAVFGGRSNIEMAS